MKVKVLGAFLLLCFLVVQGYAQSSLKVIAQPLAIIPISGAGITTGLGYEWQRDRHLLHADLAASLTPGLYLGCGQGATSLNFRAAYNYHLLGSRLRMFWNLGTGASMYFDSNSECGSSGRNFHPHLNTGMLLKLRLSRVEARHPMHLNFNFSADVGPIYLRDGYFSRFTSQGWMVLPVSYFSLSIGLGKRWATSAR